MSTQAELEALLADAHRVLHEIEGLAVDERNRVGDAIRHAVSVAESMVVHDQAVSTPEAAHEAPVSTPDAPVDAQGPSEVSSDTKAQDAPASKAKTKAKRSS